MKISRSSIFPFVPALDEISSLSLIHFTNLPPLFSIAQSPPTVIVATITVTAVIVAAFAVVIVITLAASLHCRRLATLAASLRRLSIATRFNLSIPIHFGSQVESLRKLI